jgi:hypothetical protein
MDFVEVPVNPAVPFDGRDFFRTALQASWIPLPGWRENRNSSLWGAQRSTPHLKIQGGSRVSPASPRGGGDSPELL